MTAPDDLDLPESLARPARALLDAIDRARALKDREREAILGLLGTALEAIHAAARTLERRPAGSPSPEALAGWSHSLREPLTTVVAWVQMLGMNLFEAKRAQGRETIERNVRTLVRLLREPPGPAS